MPVFYDFILQPERLGSQSLLADHTPAASQNVFFPPVPNHETEGDFLSKVYFDTLIPTSAAAGPCIGAVFVRSYPGQRAQPGPDPPGISSRWQLGLRGQIPVHLIWLSKDLRMLQCYGRVFSDDVSDDTFFTSLHVVW